MCGDGRQAPQTGRLSPEGCVTYGHGHLGPRAGTRKRRLTLGSGVWGFGGQGASPGAPQGHFLKDPLKRALRVTLPGAGLPGPTFPTARICGYPAGTRLARSPNSWTLVDKAITLPRTRSRSQRGGRAGSAETALRRRSY